MNRLAAAWDDFFFRPRPATTIGLFRILFGLLALAYALLIADDLFTWFGRHGVVSVETLRRMAPGPRINLLLLLPQGDGWLVAFFAGFVMAAICLTLGLFTRASSVLVFLGLISFHHRNPFILNSGDTMMRSMAFFLMFSAAGEALSLDRLLRLARGTRDRSPALAAPWAQRMIQLQLAIAYLATVVYKSKGATWFDGTAVYYSSRLEDFQRLHLPFLFESLPVVKALTWGTLFLEVSLGALIWIRPLRHPLVAAGILFHLGLEITMIIPIFQWVMIAALLAFIDPEDLQVMAEKTRRWLQVRLGPGPVVYFDGQCAFCRRTAAVIQALDVLGRLSWVDFRSTAEPLDRERAEREMLVKLGGKDDDGEWLGGFYAVRRIAGSLPALWPLLPWLYLPGVSRIGERVYAWVARRRFLLLGGRCGPGDTTCRLHSPPGTDADPAVRIAEA